jgi:hypothetical protein
MSNPNKFVISGSILLLFHRTDAWVTGRMATGNRYPMLHNFGLLKRLCKSFENARVFRKQCKGEEKKRGISTTLIQPAFGISFHKLGRIPLLWEYVAVAHLPYRHPRPL